MKKFILFLFVLFLGWGCDRNDKEIVLCDAMYTWEFIVKTGMSDKEIIISSDYPYSTGFPKELTNDSGEDDVIFTLAELSGCNPNEPLSSLFEDDGNLMLNPSSTPAIPGTVQFKFIMTIDGEEISDEIWLLKHWIFASDPDNFYHATYTLTLTEELLASLPSPTEKK